MRSDSWWKRSNLDAFAPRLGASWAPFGQKTVIHMGFGYAFDPIATYLAAAAANSNVFGTPHKATGTPYVFGLINDLLTRGAAQ